MGGPMAVVALCAMLTLTIHTCTGLLYRFVPGAARGLVLSYDKFMHNAFIGPYGLATTTIFMCLLSFGVAYLVIQQGQREVVPKNKLR